MDSEKKEKFKISDLYNNKRYYAIFNLSFWVIIILILTLSVRNNDNSNKKVVNNSNNNKGEIIEQSRVDGFNNIKSKNFNFKYELKINDETKIYEGKQFDKKIYFNEANSKDEYMIQDNVVLKKENDKYLLSSNPEEKFNFFDVNIIEKIISNSTTDEDDYVISINNFLTAIGKDLIEDFDEELIYNIKKKNSIITDITFDLSNFYSIDNKNINSATLNLSYTNFGLVEDFEIK